MKNKVDAVRREFAVVGAAKSFAAFHKRVGQVAAHFPVHIRHRSVVEIAAHDGRVWRCCNFCRNDFGLGSPCPKGIVEFVHDFGNSGSAFLVRFVVEAVYKVDVLVGKPDALKVVVEHTYAFLPYGYIGYNAEIGGVVELYGLFVHDGVLAERGQSKALAVVPVFAVFDVPIGVLMQLFDNLLLGQNRVVAVAKKLLYAKDVGVLLPNEFKDALRGVFVLAPVVVIEHAHVERHDRKIVRGRLFGVGLVG